MQFSWITPEQSALVLAPMEGVTDAPMRTLLTERGGLSFCVSEFLRVSHELLPPKVFTTHVPELEMGCKTPAGTPLQIQLLGGNEEKMAENAKRACEVGALAIDLNFGCPAPLVNRHDGGASLLRYPERLQRIVAAVRKAVPQNIPVSAKLRLGWESLDDIYTNAECAALGGASWITIHARTKTQGYAPPVHWKYIGEVRRRLGIPVVANGDIWTLEDFLRCQEVTGCRHFMVGRGALANPPLIHEIGRQLGLPLREQLWGEPFLHRQRDWVPLLARFVEISAPTAQHSQYTVCRIKQWLKMAANRNQFPWFDEVKKGKSLDEIFSVLRQTEVF